MADKDSSSRKEPSDLFKVENATPSLAPVDKIVLPPEEALKRRIRRFIAAGIAAVIFFFIAHLVLGWIHDARLASALDEVISDSSPDAIDDALSLLRLGCYFCCFPGWIVSVVTSEKVAFHHHSGIPVVHETYQDLIADPTIDAIYIGVVTELHFALTKLALEHGKHVLDITSVPL